MSIESLKWALEAGEEHGLEPTQRYILVILGNRADEQGFLFPSVKWVMKRTGLAESTIRAHISDLAQRGLLRRDVRKREDGGQSSNYYYLAMAQPGLALDPGPDSGGGVLNAGPGGTKSTPPPRRQSEGPPPSAGPQETQEVKQEKKGRASRAPAKPAPEAPTTAAWNAYAEEMQGRYSWTPPRSATVNGQLSTLVKRVGAEDAVKLVRHFFAVKNDYYDRRKYELGLLLTDCQKLLIDMHQRERIASASAERWWEDPGKVAERARAEGVKPEQGDSYARIAARLFVRLGDGPWMHRLDPLVAKYVREYSERGVPA